MTATHTTESHQMDGAQSPSPTHPEVGHDPARLQRDLRDHMLFNFTDMSRFRVDDMPVFVRGEGCHVIDVHGRRFIDGLSGLFCTNLGHSYGREVGAAALAQMSELVYTPTWTVAHPAAIALATRIASYAPSGMEHVFFTNSGSEAVESAWKLARQWHAAQGDPGRRKAMARRYAYHGTTMGALSFTGYASARAPFEPLAVPDAPRVAHLVLPAPPRARRGGVHPVAARRHRGRSGVRGPRDDRHVHRRAGAELRGAPTFLRPATGRGCETSATSTASSSSPTRSSLGSVAWASGSGRCASVPSPT